MSALDRTLAFEQVHDVAVSVAEDLNLDVPGRFEIGFDKQRGVAERGLRFLTSHLEQRRELGRARTMRMPRPPPPAEALIISGQPNDSAWRRTWSAG